MYLRHELEAHALAYKAIKALPGASSRVLLSLAVAVHQCHSCLLPTLALMSPASISASACKHGPAGSALQRLLLHQHTPEGGACPDTSSLLLSSTYASCGGWHVARICVS